LQLFRDFAAVRDDIPALTEKVRQVADSGLIPRRDSVTENELRHWFRVAVELCDAGRFQEAFPVALNLALHEPLDHRHGFMLGSCLQRLGHPREAIEFFAVSMEARPNAAACFRMGECHAACGQVDEAIQAFDMCAVLALGESASNELRARSLSAAHALSTSATCAPTAQ
jgi:tetratricopeptide (TPR) repeat protein